MAKKKRRRRAKPRKKEKNKEVTIIIPAFNEEGQIAEAIEEVHNTNPDALILAVDDGSTDNTSKELAKLKSKVHITILEHAQNEGYGAALKHAFRHVNTPYVAFLDADLTYDPSMFPVLLTEMKRSELDCAWTNRFGGTVNEMPGIRKIGNRIIALSFWLLTRENVRDCTSGQRVFKRNALEQLDFDSLPDGPGFISALTKRTVSRGLKYGVIGTDYRRRKGESKQKIFSGFIRILAGFGEK